MTTTPRDADRRDAVRYSEGPDRLEQDRRGYLDCTRAAHAMRADARGFRAIAAESAANREVYGTRADIYAAGMAARYEILANFADYEASVQEEYAADYLSRLGVEDVA